VTQSTVVFSTKIQHSAAMSAASDVHMQACKVALCLFPILFHAVNPGDLTLKASFGM
jgi:hypothetical protein